MGNWEKTNIKEGKCEYCSVSPSPPCEGLRHSFLQLPAKLTTYSLYRNCPMLRNLPPHSATPLSPLQGKPASTDSSMWGYKDSDPLLQFETSLKGRPNLRASHEVVWVLCCNFVLYNSASFIPKCVSQNHSILNFLHTDLYFRVCFQRHTTYDGKKYNSKQSHYHTTCVNLMLQTVKTIKRKEAML